MSRVRPKPLSAVAVAVLCAVAGCGSQDVVAAAAAAPAVGPAREAVASAGTAWRLRGPFDDVSVAARAAARTKKRVELTARRTASTRVYINPNGTTTRMRKDRSGHTTRTTVNTPPSVNHDQRQTPEACYGNSGVPSVTTRTPTLRVSASDVDHAVHHARVRVLFEIWPVSATQSSYSGLDPADAIAVGRSTWVKQNTLASWKVPPGILDQGESYVWRARADDGHSVSRYTAWYWQLFDVDTKATPSAQPCPGDQLDQLATDQVGGALAALVDAHPAAYAPGYSTPQTWPVFCVARRSGRTDAATAAVARTAARRAVLALRGEITDEYKRDLLDVLRVRVVRFSQAQLQAVVDDIAERLDRADPTLPQLTGWGVEPEANVVGVEAVQPTAAQTQALRARYGDRVRIHVVDEAG